MRHVARAMLHVACVAPVRVSYAALQSAWSPRGYRVAAVRGGDRRPVVRTVCAGGWGRQSGERSVRRVVLGAAGQVLWTPAPRVIPRRSVRQPLALP